MSVWSYEWLSEQLDVYLVSTDPEEPKEKKRRRIAGAAAELFVAQGYRKTSVDEIAERAGVAKGTVYLYFKTKIDMLVYAIVLEKKRYLVQMKPIFDERLPPAERLKRWLTAALVMANEMPLVSKLITGPDLPLIYAELPAEVLRGQTDLAADFIHGLVDDVAPPHRWNPVDLEDRGRVLLGVVYFAAQLAQEQVRQGLSLERYAWILAELLADGLASPGSSSEPRANEDEEGGRS